VAPTYTLSLHCLVSPFSQPTVIVMDKDKLSVAITNSETTGRASRNAMQKGQWL